MQPTHQYPSDLTPSDLDKYIEITQKRNNYIHTESIEKSLDASGWRDRYHSLFKKQSEGCSASLCRALENWKWSGRTPIPAYMLGCVGRAASVCSMPDTWIQKFCMLMNIPPKLNRKHYFPFLLDCNVQSQLESFVGQQRRDFIIRSYAVMKPSLSPSGTLSGSP
jgi:hypothetical protein